MKQPINEYKTLGATLGETEQINDSISSLQRKENELAEVAINHFLKVYPTLPSQDASRDSVSPLGFEIVPRQLVLGVACICLLIVAGFLVIKPSMESDFSSETRVADNGFAHEVSTVESVAYDTPPLAKLIEQASIGETLFLESSVYGENLTITKPIRIASRQGNVRIGDTAARTE